MASLRVKNMFKTPLYIFINQYKVAIKPAFKFFMKNNLKKP